MGAVYKARDPEIDRTVALKTINPLLLSGQAEREEFLERFRREARAAGRLSHPNIVSVYDLGSDEATGTPFIVMEYVPGTSLETVLAENPSLPVEQVVEVLEQVSAALTEAHRNGVVHRDVKPANVFLDPRGRVKVGDFGVARLEGSELTQAGAGLGTPGYSAPEVLRGAPADARSDVFALGVLAYRALTGQRPFPATTREATAIEILERSPASPASLRPEIPEHISQAVMRALAKSREERTASAEAFAASLRAGPLPAPTSGAALAGPAPVAADTEPVPTATIVVPTVASPGRRGRWRVALVVLALAALAGLALALRRGSEAPPSATGAPQTTPAAAPRSRPVEAPRTREAAPTPAADRGIEAAARERLREELAKIVEKQREGDGKPQEGKKPKGKQGRGKGRGKKN
jgi:eukaryotic-like serine/threonine-protein kinase